ncbi:hypothetical protein, partial [Myroides sp. DF42-4-2]|uniref:hypothetical protein n=1 Tax=Myroides sp. DF42-4-2 TaxID=2746726 RepID=UPI0025760EE3
MIRKVIPLMALFATGFVTAQVGIGTVTPANSSQLDIVSTNKGVLFPRVILNSETDKDAISGDLTESLFVYNLGHEDFPSGFYYWKKDKWVRLLNSQSYVNTTNQSFTLIDNHLTITDSDGNTVSLSLDEIVNNSNFITEIVNKLKGKYGNVYYNTEDHKFYYLDDNGAPILITWEDLNTTNVSFTLEDDFLMITDLDNRSVRLAVQDIASNLTFVNKLTENPAFITEIINKLKGKYGNVYYNIDENKFYYIQDDGTEGTIDWSSINTTNVSFTLDADMLTVTDSDGNKVQLDVKEIANNSTFIEELTQNQEFVTKITNNNEFITEIINKLKGKYGNVYYNVDENRFYYIQDDGTEGTIDWSSINTTNVSFTLDADMLTVTDSDGNKVQLDVKEIANNSIFIEELTQNQEFVTKITSNNEFITEVINKLKGKYGNVYYNIDENRFYYIQDDGTEGTIDWSSINTTNVSFTLDADMLTVTDSDGNKVQLDVKEIANNSTFIEELTQNQEFVTKITNNNEFITEVINKLKGKYGNVYYNVDENRFYYIQDDGTEGTIDWSSINTTNVSFTLDADMLTVTDSDGNKVQLDVKEIANNSTFIEELTQNQEFVTKITSNNEFITEIINKLKGKYGNVYYNVDENRFYYIQDDGTEGTIDWSSINTTNVSFTLDADMLTVTDSDGNKVQLDVKEIANNSTFIEELTQNQEFVTKITNNNEFITEIINKLKGKYGNVYYNVDENRFYYIQDDGTEGTIDWSSINTTNVSFTLDADMLTVTDSDGNKVQLDVKEIANNSTFIEELTQNQEFVTKITSNNEFITEVINKLKGKYGNVYYNVDENRFYYIQDDGTEGTIDWSSINTTNVSFTLDADMLTVTDSDGNKVQLDVKEIASNSSFITELTTNDEFITNVGNNQTLITNIVNKLKGKYGNVYYNVDENRFYYIQEDGTEGTIDWSSINTTNVSFTLDADMLTVTDSDGNKVQLDVKEIANNSTFIEELTQNQEFVTKITNNNEFITEIINKLKGKYGNVYYNVDENRFYYIQDDGTEGTIDWSSINTTNVSFTLDADMLTVTDSDGNKVQLDVKEIASNSSFITELTTNDEFITNVGNNQTLITNIVNKLKGKYGNVYYNVDENRFYYIQDDGTEGTIDWSSINTTNVSFTLDADMLTVTDSDGNKVQLDVKEIANNSTFIEELTQNQEFVTKITNNSEFITEIINKLKGKYGNVYYNVDENRFYYIQDDGTEGTIDWSSINTTNVSFTLDADMLTVTDSDGNKVQLDVKVIASNSSFITELTTNDEFITNVGNNQTLITNIVNKLKGKYGNVYYNVDENRFYYIQDDGTEGTIDWSSINTTNVSFTLDADMLTVTDSDGNKVQLDVKEIASNSSFITELTTNDEFITNVGNNQTLITNIVNKLKGKYGNVYYNVDENRFYYIQDDGTEGTIDWSSINTTNVSFTLDADMLTVTDSDGNKVQLDVKEIASNSSFITELTTNDEFITNVGNNQTLITNIVNKLKGKYGNVYYNVDENRFYYIQDDGTEGTIDWSSINTTNVSFTLDADMLTVTDSDGNKVQLDVKEIASNSSFITELTTNDEFITNVGNNQTLITNIVNKLKGKYGNVYYNVDENRFYYIQDDGTEGTIDWSSINTT